jgi:branched-chain amino acid transport system substrate-binding protein
MPRSRTRINRRSFLGTALAGGATTITLARDMSAFAQAGGPIVIGHHCELTGGFASWGYWHNKCALAAAKVINDGGGIAGRKLELVTEDTESNPAAGARKLRSLIQRNGAAFVTGSVHSGIMLASIPVATELKTIYFSTGEATEATGEKGTRYSFRTGPTPMASPPPARRGRSKISASAGPYHLARLCLGPQPLQGAQGDHREARRQGL